MIAAAIDAVRRSDDYAERLASWSQLTHLGELWEGKAARAVEESGTHALAAHIGGQVALFENTHVHTPISCVHRGSDAEHVVYLETRLVAIAIGLLVLFLSGCECTPATSPDAGSSADASNLEDAPFVCVPVDECPPGFNWTPCGCATDCVPPACGGGK